MSRNMLFTLYFCQNCRELQLYCVLLQRSFCISAQMRGLAADKKECQRHRGSIFSLVKKTVSVMLVLVS